MKYLIILFVGFFCLNLNANKPENEKAFEEILNKKIYLITLLKEQISQLEKDGFPKKPYIYSQIDYKTNLGKDYVKRDFYISYTKDTKKKAAQTISGENE